MNRIATQVALLMITAVVGCGVMPPADSGGSSSGQSVPIRVAEGTYVGEQQCQGTFTQFGVVTERQLSSFVSRNFDSNGSLLLDGIPVVVGQTITQTFGNDEIRGTLISITQTLNALEIRQNIRVERSCGDNCQFAFDGVCDEPNFCALGSDCLDCGPIVLTGTSTTTYQIIDENRIRRTLSVFAQEEDAGLLRQSIECQAILTK